MSSWWPFPGIIQWWLAGLAVLASVQLIQRVGNRIWAMEQEAHEQKVLLPTRAGPGSHIFGLRRYGLVPRCREHSGQSQARPYTLLPAVLCIVLPHVLDEVGFLQAFVSW